MASILCIYYTTHPVMLRSETADDLGCETSIYADFQLWHALRDIRWSLYIQLRFLDLPYDVRSCF